MILQLNVKHRGIQHKALRCRDFMNLVFAKVQKGRLADTVLTCHKLRDFLALLIVNGSVSGHDVLSSCNAEYSPSEYCSGLFVCLLHNDAALLRHVAKKFCLGICPLSELVNSKLCVFIRKHISIGGLHFMNEVCPERKLLRKDDCAIFSNRKSINALDVRPKDLENMRGLMVRLKDLETCTKSADNLSGFRVDLFNCNRCLDRTIVLKVGVIILAIVNLA